ncbi:MAG TPA: hypothetical protein ENI20_15330 [Bacteroides sp.]|nr:hypothetical protein [Bacteroides sp.]
MKFTFKHIKHHWSTSAKVFPLMTLLSVLLSGCFEEDQKVLPHIPGDEISFELEKSMYTTQSFYDLGTNSVPADNENGIWVIKFGALSGDWHIGINSADYWGVYPSGTSVEDSIPANSPTEDWIFDRSSGDPDSSAFAGWVVFTEEDTIYTEFIYLLGKYDGISYKAKTAVQFLHVDDKGYLFRMKDWPSGEWKEYEILKSEIYNYIYFNAANRETVTGIEPEMNSWDLLFTQYGDILYTDDGIPTPYYVRGVLLNSYAVTVAVDSVSVFQNISFEDLVSYRFSTIQDIIGYDWKDVEVDQTSNTAVYTIRPGITYIIRDTEDFFYKMRFISYYNDLGEKGYPVIEHSRL